MKKLFTILALVLTVALCASFAVSAETTLTALGSTSADVNVTYNPATTDDSTIVYSVDVAWTAGTFTYNAGTNKWDPEYHTYTASNGGQWTANDEGSVTVTNHSNAAVKVTVAYAKADGKKVEVNVENGSFDLASAVGRAVGAADAKTATFKVDTSTAPTATGKVGAVTVTIAAPAAQG